MSEPRPGARAIVLCLGLMIFLISPAPGPLRAAPKPLATSGDLTAAELLTSGFTAYGSGDYLKAAENYQKYLTDFGGSAEAASAVPGILPLLALSQVHLEKWAAASTTMELFFSAHSAKAPPATIEDLRFWEAFALARQNLGDEARGKFASYIATYPKSPRLGDARLIAGLTYISEEDFKSAGPYFAGIEKLLPPSQRSQAVLLELHSRIQNGENDTALRLVVGEYPQLPSTTRIAGFELLTLQLGSDFLASGEYRKAIAALQRVWTGERIQRHSQEMLTNLTHQETEATQRRLDPATLLQVRQDLGKVKADLATMAQIPNFDSSLQLRLASAYQGMKRYREAALLMSQMLAEMPPDPVVEKASVNLVQCWEQIARWPAAIDSADQFVRTFPKSADLPVVLLLKGQALSSDQRYAEAIPVFTDIVRRFPKADIAPRSLFLQGYTQLVNQEHAAAIATFDSFAGKYPKHALGDTVFYWRGMACSLAGQHDQAREIFSDYLRKYPAGEHVAEAHFRRAYDAQAQKKYEVSISELRAFLADFPTDPTADDARLLLGDALMAKGKVDEGIQALQQIGTSDSVVLENGIFKIAKALRLEDKPEAMRAHLENFLAEHPGSNRVAEAIYWIGWSWRQAEQPDKARELYWQAIQNLGNNPKSGAVEDLLTGVAKLYKGEDEKAQLQARYQDLASDATVKKQNVLLTRMLWAQAQMVRKSDPVKSESLLLAAVPTIDVRVLPALILADCADALQRAGETPRATALYRDLLKWNPRAIQRDRVFAGLGKIALAAGQEKEALEYFGRFEKETFGSPLLGEILLAKASLEKKRGQTTEAQTTLEKVLADKFSGSKFKAEALCTMGDILMDHDEAAKAVPYYQKIYVMYGRWTDFVARAYLGSGSAFEKLKDREAAINTYKEMITRPELADSKEFIEGQNRLTRLEAGS